MNKNIKQIVAICMFLLGMIQMEGQQSVMNNPFKGFPVAFPLGQEDFKGVSSKYGYRLHPISHKVKKHQGIDLVAELGKDVKATANGVVEKVDYDYGYGNRIIIRHSSTIKTLYAHLDEQLVEEGQVVKVGDVIGKVGGTGMVTGPHLHYEVLVKGKKINPMKFWRLMVEFENQKKEEIK